MAVEQIVDEARTWPPSKISELLERLAEELDSGGNYTLIEASWRKEGRRRLESVAVETEIRSGAAVSERMHKLAGR